MRDRKASLRPLLLSLGVTDILGWISVLGVEGCPVHYVCAYACGCVSIIVGC